MSSWLHIWNLLLFIPAWTVAFWTSIGGTANRKGCFSVRPLILRSGGNFVIATMAFDC
jgi:hypothetical protein